MHTIRGPPKGDCLPLAVFPFHMNTVLPRPYFQAASGIDACRPHR